MLDSFVFNNDVFLLLMIVTSYIEVSEHLVKNKSQQTYAGLF